MTSMKASCYSILFLFGVLLLLPMRADAQLGDFGSIIQGGIEDGEKLATEYLRPFGSGFGADLNTGWTNTGPVHGVLGFSVNVRVGTALVPEMDQTFDLADMDFNSMRLADQSQMANTLTPTLSGASQPGPEMEVVLSPEGQDYEYVANRFNMPEGTGYAIVPAPMVQANVGIIRDTEIAVRYFPAGLVSGMGDFDVNLIGAGVKHELNQYIPGGGLWPVTITAMGGFTQLGASYDGFSLTPGDYDTEPHNAGDFPMTEWEDQGVSLTTTAWNANLLVGRNLPLISAYAGLGIESSNMRLLTEGNYPLIEPDPTPEDPERTRVNSESEPIDIDIDGRNDVRALAGVRLRFFGILHITAEYTYAEYQVLNVGVGVGLR